MFSLSKIQEMQTEYRLIEDEIASCLYYLNCEHCTATEKKIFTAMLELSRFQKAQVGIILDDYIDQSIGITEITKLLSA